MTVKEYFTKNAPTMENIAQYIDNENQDRVMVVNVGKCSFLTNDWKIETKTTNSYEITKLYLFDTLPIGGRKIVDRVTIPWQYVVYIEEYNAKPKEEM